MVIRNFNANLRFTLDHTLCPPVGESGTGNHPPGLVAQGIRVRRYTMFGYHGFGVHPAFLSSDEATLSPPNYPTKTGKLGKKKDISVRDDGGEGI